MECWSVGVMGRSVCPNTPILQYSSTPLSCQAMPKYNYVAMDAHGKETKGTLEVTSQNEAIGRVKEMGLFPTKIVEIDKAKEKDAGAKKAAKPAKGKGG